MKRGEGRDALVGWTALVQSTASPPREGFPGTAGNPARGWAGCPEELFPRSCRLGVKPDVSCRIAREEVQTCYGRVRADIFTLARPRRRSTSALPRVGRDAAFAFTICTVCPFVTNSTSVFGTSPNFSRIS
jgi:hypothetical protein